jgi:hypothetical protein
MTPASDCLLWKGTGRNRL